MNPNKNWNCDNDKCTSPTGEVRKLPTGGGGNLILCHACYVHELRFREERNKELGRDAFLVPAWVELEAYECQWFLACKNPATRVIEHPIIGPVSICASCAEKVGRL